MSENILLVEEFEEITIEEAVEIDGGLYNLVQLGLGPLVLYIPQPWWP